MVIIVWKESSKDLLNPTDMSPVNESESGDEGNDSPITRSEVTKAVK